MTIHDYFEDFINFLKAEKDASAFTIANYTSDFSIFSSFIGSQGIKPTVDAITTPLLRKYTTFLKIDKKYEVETIRRKINSLRSFFNFLISQEYLVKNPMAPITAPKNLNVSPSTSSLTK